MSRDDWRPPECYESSPDVVRLMRKVRNWQIAYNEANNGFLGTDGLIGEHTWSVRDRNLEDLAHSLLVKLRRDGLDELWQGRFLHQKLE